MELVTEEIDRYIGMRLEIKVLEVEEGRASVIFPTFNADKGQGSGKGFGDGHGHGFGFSLRVGIGTGDGLGKGHGSGTSQGSGGVHRNLK